MTVFMVRLSGGDPTGIYSSIEKAKASQPGRTWRAPEPTDIETYSDAVLVAPGLSWYRIEEWLVEGSEPLA